MKTAISLLTFLLFSATGLSTQAEDAPDTREPIPFVAPAEDGFVLTYWEIPEAQALADRLREIHKAGALHVTIPYFGCQETRQTETVGTCQVTPKDLPETLARAAKAEGLHFSFLPILTTPHWEWRGFFEPASPENWVRSYAEWLKPIAALSQELGATELVLGSEFQNLYRTEAIWRWLAGEMRKTFKGPLVLTVNWDSPNYSFWGALDAIGISAYPPLANSETPTDVELVARWKSLKSGFLALSKKWKRPLQFNELGYPSVSTAAMRPWDFSSAGKVDWELQKRCYAAFAAVWAREKGLGRVSFWSVDEPRSPGWERGFDPLGKPAQVVLQDFFKNRLLAQQLNNWNDSTEEVVPASTSGHTDANNRYDPMVRLQRDRQIAQ